MRSASTIDPTRGVAAVGAYLRDCVRIDTRALAVFRILAALLIVADLALRSRNFSYFYTDTTDRYYVFPALTESGERLDVYNDRDLTYDRPDADLQTQYGTYRERFYMSSVRTGEPPDATTVLAEHVCDEWNASGDDPLTHVNMYVVEETVTFETIDAPEDRDTAVVELHRHGCGDNEPTAIDPPADP